MQSAVVVIVIIPFVVATSSVFAFHDPALVTIFASARANKHPNFPLPPQGPVTWATARHAAADHVHVYI